MNTLPRWIEIVSGILLGIGALLTAALAVAMLVVAPANDTLAKVVGAAMLLLSLWCLEKTLRLVFEIRRQHGLMSPFTLRVAAVAFLLMPVNGFFGDYYKEHGALAVEQAVTYVFISAGLWEMARRRARARDSETSTFIRDASSKASGASAQDRT